MTQRERAALIELILSVCTAVCAGIYLESGAAGVGIFGLITLYLRASR